MPLLRSLVRLIPIGLALSAPVAGAASPPRGGAGEIELSGLRPVRSQDPTAQNALTRGASWQRFESLHGGWKVVWNEATGTPHRAFGRGIALEGYAADPSSVDRAVRGFIAGNADLFGPSPELATVAATPAGGIWYVRYQQTVNGVPVLFSDWEFRVTSTGRLIAFGADARRPGAEVVTTPRLVAAVAREAAKSGLRFDPTTDRVERGSDLYLLPLTTRGVTELRLVYDVGVQIARPRANWIALVDAADGRVLWRHNRVLSAVITGRVTAQIHPTKPSDALVTRNLKDAYVNVGGNQVVTDADGLYSGVCSGNTNVSALISGRWCHVTRLDCSCDASFSRNVLCGSTQDITWNTTNSHDAERDAYYHVVVAHDYVKGIDPVYTANDVDFQVWVNTPGDECSSYWDGASINLGEGGSTCPAMATVPDIVYHEYGHRVNDNLYFSLGQPFGMVNETLHEGLADIYAAFLTDDPVIADGYQGVGTSLRNLTVHRAWPQDASVDSHESGQILSGALWDLRASAGLATAAHLSHFAKYGVPDDTDDGVAMSEYFIEMLVADDNDADLSNGTPNFSQIAAAFNAHGIGTNYFIQIVHAALDDQPGGTTSPINAVIQYTGPFGSLDTSSPTLYVTAGGQPFVSIPMSPTGNPDEWGTELPGYAATVVRYYIRAADGFGGVATDPPGAPVRLHSYVGGPASLVTSADMETDPGWIVGSPADNATTGIWLRDYPVASIAQPGYDHTSGTGRCWVTGNAAPDDPPGVNDVDDGQTTLTTATFNATAGGIVFPIVSYYRWYTNNTGEAPSSDFWKVDISNNGGGTWVPVENTSESDPSWRRVVFLINDYLPPTNNMKLRFTASDLGDLSLVEAAVDDFSLLAFTGPVGVTDPAPVRSLSLAPAAPNPFRAATRLHYTLASTGRAVVSVYDINGRAVRTLVSADQTPGPHSIDWDGRDDAGRPVASGPYFVRLAQSGRKLTQAVVRIR